MHIELLRKQAFNVRSLQDQLAIAPWDEIRHRTSHPRSPHREVSDIWVRYNPIENFKGDMQKFNEEHIAQWYPVADIIPEAVRISIEVFKEMRGLSLGAVLITRIPPGGQVYPHIDQGWHARTFEKFAVQVKGNDRQAFHFERESLSALPGDLYWFDNAYSHWVTNDSDEDRITLIVCVRRH